MTTGLTIAKQSPGRDPDLPLDRVELPPFSMYVDTPIYQVNGEVVFGLLREPIIPDSTDQKFVVSQITQNRLDLISQQVYETPHLWWVIAMVNNIVDPLSELPTGTTLRVPLRSRLSIPGI